MGIFNSIGSIFATPLGFIMQWCYLFVNDLLKLPVSYVFALFTFTLVTKLLLFPLSLKQQRSSAVMQAYQPLINEINQKYADDPKKRQEEMTKIQNEYGYNPMSGCLPLLIQFPIIFGLIEVVYKPLTYMLRIPKDVMKLFSEKATQIAGLTGSTVNERYIETKIIELVKSSASQFSSLAAPVGVSEAELAGYVSKIDGLNMTIGHLNLWEIPKLEWSPMLLIPIFSIATIILSSFISQWAARGRAEKNSQMQVTNISMILISTVMFGWMSFTLPAAFGLYWGFSNIVIIVQSVILRKIVNADTIRKQSEEKIAEKKRQQKEVKTVKIKDKVGNLSEKEMSADEMARYRLQRARELDEKRYSSLAQPDSEKE
ncbi:MAG: YidC/Oxa1 family membrane protein insertase [Oscillospiraceae bacterium]|nr:YidC/Oxa1 family membrane protein insertase [Oscillospiraceae bacterium]